MGQNVLAGLCGNLNGRDDDDLRMPDNALADNALKFAKSWADQDAACAQPEDIDACEANPDRRPWAEKGEIRQLIHHIFM